MSKELIIIKIICVVGAFLALILVFKPRFGIVLNDHVLNMKIKSCGFEGSIKACKGAGKIVRVQAFLIFLVLIVLAVAIKF